ncbi:MAG: hypothetical protein NUW21_04460 [Elusimicrobia bacterium]|nr:hypothetical protein [Elusimicrobiota bacterium]
MRALAMLNDVPGHGTNAKEVTRAYRSNAYIQFTPTPGRIFTVTDPADPLLEKWIFRKERVSFVTRKVDGEVDVCVTVPAEVAVARLRAALAKTSVA